MKLDRGSRRYLGVGVGKKENEVRMTWTTLICLVATALLTPAPPSRADPPPEGKPPQLKTKRGWGTPLPRACMSSPRVSDVNGDQVKDVLIGAGFFEERQDASVAALDGKTGAILWKFDCPADVFVTPELVDINGDGVVDLLVGGRFNDLLALNGKNGELLWILSLQNPGVSLPPANFNSPVLVPDLDQDSFPEILVATGGLTSYRVGVTEAPEASESSETAPPQPPDKTEPKPAQEGPPGLIFQVSSRTGKILKTIEAPDQREIYSMPAVFHNPKSQRHEVVYGTGGERINGHVIKLDLRSLKEIWRFPSLQKGFMASPIACDFSGEGVLDVVAASFEGDLYRLNGETGQPIWRATLGGGFETYSSPAIGRFNDDDHLDVVAVFGKGVWPDYDWAHIVWVDGRSGRVIAQEPLGRTPYSSPLVLNIDGDSYDETLAAGFVGRYTEAAEVAGSQGRLVLFDGRSKKSVYSIGFEGLVAGTPHVSDIDGDGHLDIVWPHFGNVTRLTLITPGPRPQLWWNQFHGPRFDGVYRRN